ncbi:MAG: 30S ribosomal protein S3ae [Thermofilaceae archaeon]
MSERVSREARSKWEAKKWFRVLAPSAFGFAEIALVPAKDASALIGRTVEISFFDITKDVSQLPTKLKFQIVSVNGDTAYTQLKQMELTRDYIRSLVRRGTSRIDAVVDVETADGIRLRVMGLAVTQRRVKTSQKKAIRKVMFDLIAGKASSMKFDEFIQEIVLGKLATEIEVAAKKIYPLRKAEIRKVKVLTRPFEIAELVQTLSAVSQ